MSDRHYLYLSKLNFSIPSVPLLLHIGFKAVCLKPLITYYACKQCREKLWCWGSSLLRADNPPASSASAHLTVTRAEVTWCLQRPGAIMSAEEHITDMYCGRGCRAGEFTQHGRPGLLPASRLRFFFPFRKETKRGQQIVNIQAFSLTQEVFLQHIYGHYSLHADSVSSV